MHFRSLFHQIVQIKAESRQGHLRHILGKGGTGRHLGGIWRDLGVSWSSRGIWEAYWSHLRGILEATVWRDLGASWSPRGIWEASWSYLGGILEASGETWESPGVQKASGRHLGVIWEASWRHLQRPANLLESLGGSWMLLEAPGGCPGPLGPWGSRWVLEHKCVKTMLLF
jgi:hypothetical protein